MSLDPRGTYNKQAVLASFPVRPRTGSFFWAGQTGGGILMTAKKTQTSREDAVTDNVAGKKAKKAGPAGERSPGDKAEKEKEIGGPKGPEPTRYGDWEQKGRCTDF